MSWYSDETDLDDISDENEPETIEHSDPFEIMAQAETIVDKLRTYAWSHSLEFFMDDRSSINGMIELLS